MAETRITAGAWRGRLVFTGRSTATRPTTSRVREAVFNIIAERTQGAVVLDLYAGAGTIGFEALSRGATSVTFVERDRDAVDLIRRTSAHLGCTDRVRIVVADVPVWLGTHAREVAAADLCYLDAPYADGSVVSALGRIGSCPSALVVCEHHRARELPETAGGLERTRQARYGMARLSFYTRSADGEGRDGGG